jgi:malate dehydrogenase (oxaloacetate-decarboxylating)(NADP+)
LAREAVPEEVAAAYGGKSQSFGPDYIIPAPFDPRLIEIVPIAVAEQRLRTGVAQKPIGDRTSTGRHSEHVSTRRHRSSALHLKRARSNPKRVLFAEGDEPNVLRAAIAFKEGGYGTPVLVGREDVYDMLKELGVDNPREYEVLNSRNFAVGRARGRLPSTPSISATACSAARLSGWSIRTAITSLPRCSRWARPTR